VYVIFTSPHLYGNRSGKIMASFQVIKIIAACITCRDQRELSFIMLPSLLPHPVGPTGWSICTCFTYLESSELSQPSILCEPICLAWWIVYRLMFKRGCGSNGKWVGIEHQSQIVSSVFNISVTYLCRYTTPSDERDESRCLVSFL